MKMTKTKALFLLRKCILKQHSFYLMMLENPELTPHCLREIMRSAMNASDYAMRLNADTIDDSR